MKSTRGARRRRAIAGVVGSVLCAFALAAGRPAAADDPFLRRTATVRAAEKVGPAVVNIVTERVVSARNPFGALAGDPTFDRFYDEIFAPRHRQTAQSLGSGVIIDSEGHVLTNEHVVARASRIRVALADGREFDATPIGTDPNNDLAVLRVDTEEALPWVEPGISTDLLVGEPVIAIGNPFGLSSTVTTGVISALDRSVRASDRVFHGFLQTDASINPGNSGGPLVNAEGSVIAINSAIFAGGEGIGFAIPIDTAKRVVAELIEHGEVPPVWLGLGFQDLDPALREVMALPEGVFGILVNNVREKSPAVSAGVERGDIVTHFEGRPLANARAFFEMLETVTAGQNLELEIWREGAKREIVVVAEEFPDDLIPWLADQLLGMKLFPRQQGGFQVERVRAGSGAAISRIEAGDVILALNGRKLAGEEDLRRAVLALRGRPSAMLVVERGGGRYPVTIPLV